MDNCVVATVVFFFSSKRRHTRCSRDWSSDVCSSDLSRRSFYRSLKEQQPAEEELEVRSAIQQIALGHRRRYGYRRITAELHRRGMQINHKRVVRISLPPPPPPPRAPSQPLGDPCRLAARRTLNAEARPASVHSRDSVCATASGRSQTHSFSYPPWGRRGWKSSGGSW